MVRTETGRFERTIGPGDTLGGDEGLIIDAQDSYVGILANGGEIRNVAITNANNHPAPIVVRNGNVSIEHCYISDVNDNCVFVHEQFGGTLTVDQCNFRDAVEDALYGSPPGNPNHDSGKANPGGAGGTVHVKNSYCENCGDYGWRLGQAGSELINSKAKNCRHAAANLYGKAEEGGVLIQGCDLQGNQSGIKLIDPDTRNIQPDWGETVLTRIEDTRVSAGDEVLFRPPEQPARFVQVQGQPGFNPDLSVPDHVPTSPTEAAQGGTQAPSPSPSPSPPSGEGEGEGRIGDAALLGVLLLGLKRQRD